MWQGIVNIKTGIVVAMVAILILLYWKLNTVNIKTGMVVAGVAIWILLCWILNGHHFHDFHD